MSEFTDALEDMFKYMNKMEGALNKQADWLLDMVKTTKPTKDENGEDMLVLKGPLLDKFLELPHIWKAAYESRPDVDQTLKALGVERDDEPKRTLQ